MYNISWKPEYNLGHSVIDREHKYLFEIAGEAFEPVTPELRKTKIKNTIERLNEYMQVHFLHEESFMRVIEYPNLKDHEAIHQSIIENMKSLLAKIQTLNIKEFEKDLAFFIEISLVGHILQEDKKIQDWYKNKKGQRHVINWNDKYLVGQEDIDTEHQLLFKIANEAFKEGESTNRKQKIKDIVLKLSSYTSSHFKHEEEFMKEIGYPQYEHHCEKHEKIIKEINAFIKVMSAMDIQTFELELAIFIEKWLVQHIIYEDKKIQNFLDADDGPLIELSEL
ncbi:MAG: bacteriohemerythrin [Sulfurimonas sp.]|nr:bacteriohemerythrin [Sulfurimonas sp.]